MGDISGIQIGYAVCLHHIRPSDSHISSSSGSHAITVNLKIVINRTLPVTKYPFKRGRCLLLGFNLRFLPLSRFM
ncbi:hypothetical protein PRBEI_2001825000 [Prionailurus iriomotensis]